MKSQVLIGKRIKEYRKRSGLTQEALAEKVQLSAHYVSAVECGRSFPRIDVLIDIINAINASADQIFCDVIDKSYVARTSILADIIDGLSPVQKRQIISVIETMTENFKTEQ